MKIQLVRLPAIALVLLALSTIIYQPSTLRAQGTAFTYQDRLQNNGSPAGSGVTNANGPNDLNLEATTGNLFFRLEHA